MFSIIIPLYNKEISLPGTLESILNQTYTDYEVVIVNDGSTDQSVEEAKKFSNLRIRLIHQENSGVSEARNRGIREAWREWMVFIDADDLWLPDHLTTLADMIGKYPEDKVFSTSYVRSTNKERLKDPVDTSVAVIENYYTEAIRGHFFHTSASCIHQSIFDYIGYFNSSLITGEDQEMWVRIGRKYRFIHSHKITSIYQQEVENPSHANYDIRKNFFYQYDFESSESKEETEYARRYIIRYIYYFASIGKIQISWMLWNRHKKHLAIRDFYKIIINKIMSFIVASYIRTPD